MYIAVTKSGTREKYFTGNGWDDKKYAERFPSRESCERAVSAAQSEQLPDAFGNKVHWTWIVKTE